MSSDGPRPDGASGLACLDGAEPPAGLAEDLRAVVDLPDGVLRALWPLIDASLPDPVPEHAPRAIGTFAEAHGVDPAHVARAVSAVRALCRFAAAADLSAEALEKDIRALAGDRAEPLGRVITGWYEPARARVQSELLARTVAAHGKVLTDVEWRLETINASSFGRGFRLPLVTLTLRYEEDGRSTRITFHALPTVLKKLKDTLARLVK